MDAPFSGEMPNRRQSSASRAFRLTARDVAHLNVLVDRLRARGASLEELTPLRSSLEDVFVALVAPSGQASGTSEEKP